MGMRLAIPCTRKVPTPVAVWKMAKKRSKAAPESMLATARALKT